MKKQCLMTFLNRDGNKISFTTKDFNENTAAVMISRHFDEQHEIPLKNIQLEVSGGQSQIFEVLVGKKKEKITLQVDLSYLSGEVEGQPLRPRMSSALSRHNSKVNS